MPMPTATELLTQLREGTLTATDLMVRTLDRIEAVNGSVNALVGLADRARLIEMAQAADKADVRGPLHGLPIAIKDMVNVAGLRSTKGSPAFSDNVPTQDDLIAARLRAAGALIIGKTNVPEFGLGSHTYNPIYGATRNPYDPARTCGGSSGGAAVALATGMLALADGSDMMGSLRNPAAWNNVYGFRPSWGLVPREPEGECFLHQISTAGPMARNPADLAVLLDVLAGPDPRLPVAMRHDPIAPLAPADMTGVRIGWLGDWGGAMAFEPGILDLCEVACATLRDLGAEVEPVAPPFEAEALFQSWVTLRAWSEAANLGAHKEANVPLKPAALWEIETGRKLSALDVHAASLVRSDWFRTAAALFERFDALVLPVTQVWPFPVELDYPKEIAGTKMDTYHRWMEVMVPVSLLGLPSLGMPAGFGANGLPGGIQIFGPRGADARLLGYGAAYHEATQWPERCPPPV